MKWVKDHGLGLLLFFLWMANWGLYWLSLQYDWDQFWEGTFENNASEFLQLFSMVVLTAMLIHVGSTESRDGQDRMEAKIDQILAKVEKDHG